MPPERTQTLALQHHAAEVSYEWVEALGWERRPASEDANKRGQGGEPAHEVRISGRVAIFK